MENSERSLIYVVISTILIGVVIFFGFNFFISPTGKVTDRIPENEGIYEYTYTKAICNESNHCEDYKIVCKNDNLIEITPTGMAVQMPKEWKDPRSKDEIEKTCPIILNNSK